MRQRNIGPYSSKGKAVTHKTGIINVFNACLHSELCDSVNDSNPNPKKDLDCISCSF